MSECEVCGEKAIAFTCNYCGGSYCSDHRLPENHDCEGLEEEIEKQKEENKKWFKDKDLKQDDSKSESSRPAKKPSLMSDILRGLRNNYVLAIILVTVVSFYLQQIFPGYTDLLILNSDLYGSATGYPGLLEQPWGLLTVMLLHGSLFHLFANMVTFYFFGSPVEKILGSKKMLKFYIVSGLVASIAFVIVRNIIATMHGPEFLGPAVGASGAVAAFVALVAMLYPRADVLLFFIVPMKIKTAVYGFGAFEMFNLATSFAGYTLPVVGGLASSAHLAGIAIGLYYGRKLQDRYKRETSVFDPMQY